MGLCVSHLADSLSLPPRGPDPFTSLRIFTILFFGGWALGIGPGCQSRWHDATCDDDRRPLRHEVPGDEVDNHCNRPAPSPPSVTPHHVCTFPLHEAHLATGNLSWGHTAQYCAWTGQQIPTEAEWERIAQGTWPGDDVRSRWTHGVSCPEELGSRCPGLSSPGADGPYVSDGRGVAANHVDFVDGRRAWPKSVTQTMTELRTSGGLG